MRRLRNLCLGGSCAGCTLCCKLLPIAELAKPPGRWCAHCDVAKGCRIHGEHPAECRIFHCGWLVEPALGPHWQPSACRMVVTYEAKSRRIAVHVDAGRAGAWRSEPYYGDLKRLAVTASRQQEQVIIWQGTQAVVILPDRDIALGAVGEGQLIVTIERPQGPEILVMDPDDPRLRLSAAPAVR